MNIKSRSSNFAINMKVGIIIQILNPIIAFLSRTIFIIVLGEQYLGINGLYSNILSVLSLADLGLYTAMIYSLYKPISEGKEAVIEKTMTLFVNEPFYPEMYDDPMMMEGMVEEQKGFPWWGYALIGAFVIGGGAAAVLILKKKKKAKKLAQEELELIESLEDNK